MAGEPIRRRSKRPLKSRIAWAKQPIVVRDTPGFASSRLGLVIGLEAMRMLEQEVASAEDIDKAMTLGYKHPMGPLKLTDLVGLDVRLAIAEYLHRELRSEAFKPPQILRTLVEEGRLGKKTGHGFYDWGTDCRMEFLSDALFHGFSQPSLLVIVAVSLLCVMKGADWLVDGATAIAHKLGISKIVVGATVVSLGTTAPEAAVSVMAAWSGNPGLALGNAVGSIVADTGLIFGLGCVLAVLPANRRLLSKQGWVQFGAASLLAAVCYFAWFRDGDAATVGRGVGFMFLALLVAYLVASVKWAKHRR